MPFAKHRKTMRRTMFLEHDLLEQHDSVQYFLNIVPTERLRFEKLTKLILPDNNDSNETVERRNSNEKSEIDYYTSSLIKDEPLHRVAEKLISQGIPERKSDDRLGRHYYQFYIVLHYKGLGYSEQETIQRLTEWALNERQHNRSKSTEEEIRQDVASDVRHIYLKDKHFYSSKPPEIAFSRTDMEVIHAFHEPAIKRVAWAVFVLGRMFHEEGRLYFSVRQIEKMTGCSRNTVHRRLKILLNMQFLQLIEKGEYHSAKPKASVYAVPALLKSESEIIRITPRSTEWREIFEETFASALDHQGKQTGTLT